jgi:hypothetical protein
MTGQQSNKEDEFNSEFREDQLKPKSASHMRSSERSSPQSSEISRSSESLQDAERNYKNQVVPRVKPLSSSKADGRKYSSPRSRPHGGRVQHVSR